MDYEDDEERREPIDHRLDDNESDISQEESHEHGTVNKILDIAYSEERQIIFTGHTSNMFKGFKELRDSKELLDLKLKVNEDGKDEVISVHSCILASLSPFVRAFLRNEGINKEINLMEWNKEVIEELIDWMYDGILKIKPTRCYELLESSGYLCLTEVYQECANYICDHLTIENCCEAHSVAICHQIPKFKERVNNFILNNFVYLLKRNKLTQLPIDVFLSFLEDDDLLIVDNEGFAVDPKEGESILFDLLKDYIEQNKLHDLWPSIIKSVLRFGLMDKKVLQQLFSSEEWFSKCKDKDLCSQLMKHVHSLLSSGKDFSASNPKWVKHRAGPHCTKYFWTPMVAYIKDFPEVKSIKFDDVGSILNELKSSDSPPILYVTGMKLYTNFWYNHYVISTIEVTYNTGKTILHGMVLDDMDMHEFRLQPKERIINIQGKTGWVLDSLEFETNFGQTFGPYGGKDGGKRCFTPKSPRSYLAGLKGCVSDNYGRLYVRKLRFAWASVF